MAQLILILFISIIIPLSLMSLLFRGHSRLLIIFMIIGCYVCLFSGYLCGFLKDIMLLESFRMTFTTNPLMEELLKAIPIIFYGRVFKPRLKNLLECAMIVGIGFAVLENSYYLINNAYTVSITWAIVRGIGAGLMHGLSTMYVGWIVHYINVTPRLALPGTFGGLAVAILYHGIYNMLIQSDYRFIGIILPLSTFIPILIYYNKVNREEIEKSE